MFFPRPIAINEGNEPVAIAALFVCASAVLSFVGYRWMGGFMFGLALARALFRSETGIW